MKNEVKNTANYFLANVYAQAFLRENNIELERGMRSPKYDELVKSYFELLELGVDPEYLGI